MIFEVRGFETTYHDERGNPTRVVHRPALFNMKHRCVVKVYRGPFALHRAARAAKKLNKMHGMEQV